MTGATWNIPDDVLRRVAKRAPRYDVENVFCADDLAELRDAGYLRMGVRPELGGAGMGLLATLRVQRRLAEAAPPTALALGMHQVWVQAARIVAGRGAHFLDVVEQFAAEDRLLAFGVSEPGNDRVLFDSQTNAVPDPKSGGFRFTGTKIFTSSAPAWDVLSVFGKDTSGTEPRLVHGFALRSDGGVSTLDDWDALGMRATQSRTTVLDELLVPASRIVRTLPVGPTSDPLTFGIFAAFELLIAAVYTGIAGRAIALAIDHVRSHVDAGGTLRSELPDVRRGIADMQSSLDAIVLQSDALASDIDAHADRGERWFPLLVGTKARTVDAATQIVDEAMRIVGGSAFRTTSELARLSRDVRAGGFHPSSRDSAAATISAQALGAARSDD